MSKLENLTTEKLLELIRQGDEEEKEEDAHQKAAGFPFKLVWWDHTTGGDDETHATYLSGDVSGLLEASAGTLRMLKRQNPELEVIDLILKVKRQSLNNDYKVIKL